ncbi:MAG: PadR family transcriptional regulator [Vicinamibacterales bacterium]|jgi:transcriptional regulator
MSAKRSGGELVQGTLDLLILKALSQEPMHGWGIARSIELQSRSVLRIEEGSLYPALRRLERDGFVTGKWAISDNNRRARYYALTARGRRRLQSEQERWCAVVRAMSLVLES